MFPYSAEENDYLAVTTANSAPVVTARQLRPTEVAAYVQAGRDLRTRMIRRLAGWIFNKRDR